MCRGRVVHVSPIRRLQILFKPVHMKVYPQNHRLGYREYDFLSVHSMVMARKLYFINQYTGAEKLSSH